MKKSMTVVFSSDSQMSDHHLLEIVRQISAQTQNNGLRIAALPNTLKDLEKS